MHKTMMTRSQQQFLELLRAGLWGKAADTSLFQGEVDWKAVLRIAKEQTVTAIVAEGIETLPADMWPPKEAIRSLLMMRAKTSQMHQLLNSTLIQAVKALDADGIPSVLLKGQGVAQNYRHPESRTCGDIDLYVGEENCIRACRVIQSISKKDFIEDVSKYALHRDIELNGVTIEMHRRTSGTANNRQNRAIDRWNLESLDAHFTSNRVTDGPITDGQLPVVMFDGYPVNLPPRTFDAVFILHHAARHMITEGVGLRQICDWTMFLHKHHTEINLSELEEKLHTFRMEEVWKEFGLLAVNILGLNPDSLPLVNIEDRSGKSESSDKTALLLHHIFASGNFGHYDTNGRDHSQTNIIKRKWRSLRVQTQRFGKLYRIFPRFTLSYIIGWYPSALRRLFKK